MSNKDINNEKEVRNKKGVDTKYKEEFVEMAYEFLQEGKTMKQLAQFLGISKSTLYQWKDKYDKLSDAISRGRAKADDLIEESCYEAARGMWIEEEQAFQNKTTGEITIITVRKQLPPNPILTKYWLNNRKPQEWREKKDVEMSGEIKTLKIGFSDDD